MLDFLLQHHVYPFLSLSKGVIYIARYRLFRQVYVLEYHDSILHVIKDLLCWLVITRRQFYYSQSRVYMARKITSYRNKLATPRTCKCYNLGNDIYEVASQLSSLNDLFVAESPPDMLSEFPTNIRRLVSSNSTRTTPVDCCSRFRLLLEYLEPGERVYFGNWPRVIRRRSSASSASLFPLSA